MKNEYTECLRWITLKLHADDRTTPGTSSPSPSSPFYPFLSFLPLIPPDTSADLPSVHSSEDCTSFSPSPHRFPSFLTFLLLLLLLLLPLHSPHSSAIARRGRRKSEGPQPSSSLRLSRTNASSPNLPPLTLSAPSLTEQQEPATRAKSSPLMDRPPSLSRASPVRSSARGEARGDIRSSGRTRSISLKVQLPLSLPFLVYFFAAPFLTMPLPLQSSQSSQSSLPKNDKEPDNTVRPFS